MPRLNHVLETQQFKEIDFLEELFSLTNEMMFFDKSNPTDEEIKRCTELRLPTKPRKKILANLFYEPSTRTRWSFGAAIKSLGGEILETESAGVFSSAAKGETLADTIRVTSGYVDVIVLRHPKEGSAKEAARYSKVPIINAGDGTGQHPTQALLDIYTIKQKLGRVNDLKVGMLGDLKNGRTVHSLTYLLAHRDKIKFYFISPEELKMRQDIIQYLTEKKIPFDEIGGEELRDVARNLDVLYVTRIQKERFDNQNDYEKVKGSYIVNNEIIDIMKTDSIIMHPLPRVGEIDPEIDQDTRAVYFDQAINGKYVRMALLKMILDDPNIRTT
jgi:aspartate carbamoyltransferase catalytic subunit